MEINGVDRGRSEREGEENRCPLTVLWCYSSGGGWLLCLGHVEVMDMVYGGGQCVW
jgi:hypothetical protein